MISLSSFPSSSLRQGNLPRMEGYTAFARAAATVTIRPSEQQKNAYALFSLFSGGETVDGRPVIRGGIFAKKILERLDELRSASEDPKIKSRKGNDGLEFADVGLLSEDLGEGFGKRTTIKNIFGYDVTWYYLNGEQLVHPLSPDKDRVRLGDYEKKLMQAIKPNNNGVIFWEDFQDYINKHPGPYKATT